MKKLLPRNFRTAKKVTINFKVKNKIISFDHRYFCKKVKVHDIIKCSHKEFKNLKLFSSRKYFYHFNIFNTVHKKAQKYLMVKILKKGLSKNNRHIQPILGYKKIYVVKCLKVKNKIPYNQLKYTDYKDNLYNVKNVKDLKNNILLKYSKTLQHLDNKKKVQLGVGITKLKIINIYDN